MKGAIDTYHITEKLYESSGSLIYRAVDKRDTTSVIIKVLQPDNPAAEDLSRFTSEYEITRDLHGEGVVRPLRLEEHGATLRMIEEDIGGESLDRWMKHRRLTLEECLFLGVRLAESLKSIHAADIIHKTINPSNIIWNSQTGQVQVTDFGGASRLPIETFSLKNPAQLEGTLAYVSPEQTGRMNRFLDYRTDFYSLGITLYEMLTGRLPFETQDAMEMVHCHIAKQVTAPHLVDETIPEVVSQIVMKLLAKTAEDRYQSTHCLKSDLTRCLEQFHGTGRIEAFSIAQRDFTDKLWISQKLYGRDQDIQELLDAFERASAGCAELIIVMGDSGIGKTVLVHEVHKPMVERRGYFISGKFDQYTRNIPYTAIAMAFRSLVQQLLAEPEEQLQHWQKVLSAALGVNGQVIVDIVPELENLIGEQPDLEPLGSQERKNRFKLVFQNFIQVFTKKEHPVILFLDDLQWVDSASLNLLKDIMINSQTQYLLVIGSFRDNEVPPEHPLSQTIDEITNEHAGVSQFTLTPLDKNDLNHLLADTFNTELSVIESLSELLLERTGGNPFFINQFLRQLYDSRLVRFDSDALVWTWDMDKIHTHTITDNMADMMIDRLQILPEALQRVLQLAACIGNQFDLGILSVISEHRSREVQHDLMELMKLGFILPADDQRKLISGKGRQEGYYREFKFTHDRVQQAAYTLLADEQKKGIHVTIGRLLLNQLSPPKKADTIFHIVEHLNYGKELLADDEKNQLAELNLAAGIKAKDSIAYLQALKNFKTGISLLPENSWELNYRLSFDLYKECYECEFILTHFSEADALFETIINHSNNLPDKAAIYSIIIQQNSIQANYEHAIEMGKRILKEFGIELPDMKDLEEATQQEIENVKLSLAHRQAKDLIDQPLIDDAHTKALVKILVILEAPCYFSNFPLFKYIVAKAIKFGLEEGNSPELTHAYSNFGLILCLSGEFRQGYEFGSLALLLSEKLNTFKCVAHNTMGLCINHWTKHVTSSADIARKGIHYGLEEGEIQFVCYNHFGLLNALVSQGLVLDRLLEDVDTSIHFVRENKNTMSEYCFLSIRQFARNLQGKTSDKYSFDENGYNESDFMERSKELTMSMAYFYVYKLQSYYLFENYDDAYKMSVQAQQSIHQVETFLTIVTYHFFHSLTLTALLTTAAEPESTTYWASLNANQQQLKAWSTHCPENFLNMFLLLEAEIARLKGDDWKALDLYDQSIESAHEQGFIQNEAIANELCAKFWLEKGKEDFSKLYLVNAHYCYNQWGALRKVEDLEEKYPQLLSHTMAKGNVLGRQDTPSIPSELDISTVIKASQAISGEIELKALHTRILTIMIENAGAQKGSLIVEQDGELLVAAVVDSEQETSRDVQTIPTELSVTASPAIINYVKRTGEMVVLDDASSDDRFKADPYIRENKPKSILCTRILKQTQSTGIVYLENNLITGAFTPDRLQVIDLLASQATISLENARLFEEKQKKSDELTEEIAERKQAENDLERTKNLLSETEKTGRIGGWRVDLDTLTQTWTEETYHLHEVDMDFKPDLTNGINFYAPSSKPIIEQAFNHTVETGEPFDLELELITAKGNRIWVHSVGIAQQVDGVTKAVSGSFQDITERKNAEESLKDSERFSRKLIESMSEGFSILDSNGMHIDVNPAFCKMTGFAKDELVGVGPPHPYWPEEEYGNIQEAFERTAQGHFESFELVFKTKSGKRFPVIVTPSQMKDNQGNIISNFATIMDITERKQAEAQKDRLMAAVEQSAEGIVITDAEGVIDYVNPAFERITGYSRAEARGNTPRILKSGKQDDVVYAELWRTITSGKIWRGQMVNKRKDGELYTESNVISPVKDDTGKIVNFAAVKTDVTQELLREETSRQSQKMEAIGQLAGGIAHDFNNQLSAILGCAELLIGNLTDKQQIKYATLINEGALRAAKLTAQLLAFSHKGQILSAPVSIHKIIAEVTDILEHSINKQITIRQILNADPETTLGDSNQLQNAILNVAINARDAMPDGGDLSFETTVTELDERFFQDKPGDTLPGTYLMVSISDTGSGMDAETQKHIFEPFYTTKGVGKGTGMGLASVYGTIHNHKGAIDVTSEMGHGTTFRIYLPLDKEPHPDVQEEQNTRLAKGTGQILLVDDEELVRDCTTAMLERLGYQVITCVNGKEAVDYYEKSWREIDLVLLDMIMPVMGGRETFALMKDINPDVRVILSSGYSIDGDAQAILEDGVRDFIGKPYQLNELADMLEQVLHGG